MIFDDINGKIVETPRVIKIIKINNLYNELDKNRSF